NVEALADLLALRIAHRRPQPAVVPMPAGEVLGIVDDFVHEVAQVQHEPELFLSSHPLVVVRHPPVCVLCALTDVLAAHEREPHRAWIVGGGRRARAADATPVPVLVGEAVPVPGGWPQTADQHAASMVGRREGARSRRRGYTL